MSFIDTMPVWALALVIFVLRVGDVSLGTLRTIIVVEGLTKVAVVLGFLEVFIWIVAISQVIGRIQESLWLAVAYAAGFAAGNAVGIALERKLAFGMIVLRIVSPRNGGRVATALRSQGQVLTTFAGEGRDGPVTLLYVTLARKKLEEMLALARSVDPDIFFVVERANRWGHGCRPTPVPTGWRATQKKK